jgi:pimeloyl-ACP methyl ester carboxylesterase
MFKFRLIFLAAASFAAVFFGFFLGNSHGVHGQTTRPASPLATPTRTPPRTPPAAGSTVTKTVVVTDSQVVTETATAPGDAASDVARQALTIHFADFDAAAELTYPAEGEGPFPTVILIAGSGTEDMDASICSFGAAEPLSQNFRLLADELPRHGIAVLRYNKHYVTGPCTADFMQYYTAVDLPLLLEDAGLVLAAAQANELVDPQQIYLYGWSEGSTIAASLAISNSDAVAGLVLQAPVTLPWYDTFLYQFAHVQLPHLRDLAPDGKIVPQTLLDLVQGNAGLVALGGLSYLADPAVMAQNELALNPYFDQDENGEIEIDAELLPNLRGYLDQLFAEGGPFAMYAPARALPTVGEQAADLQLPVLILQGENDANVPAFGAQLLDVLLVGSSQHMLLQYENLGHSLGEAPSVVADNFGPMAPEPIGDVIAWLTAQIDGAE